MSKFLKILAVAGGLMLPEAAMAASAIATTDVNLRSGPSTRYPAVDVVQGGDRVRVYGCLSNRSWCDVSYLGERGWMSSNYLANTYQGRRVRGPEVVRIVRAPVVSFSIGTGTATMKTSPFMIVIGVGGVTGRKIVGFLRMNSAADPIHSPPDSQPQFGEQRV